MKYIRMPIEIEAPEQLGYETIECNLTESSFTDFRFRDLGIELDDLVIAYVDHRGHRGLRTLLADETSGKIPPDQVLITAGAAKALFIIASTLLEKGDELVVIRPNYATNLETPRAIEAKLRIVDLRFEDGWDLSAETIRKAITPSTKLVSITVPHNPTGTVIRPQELEEIIRITREKGVYLLVDETYREMNFEGVLPHSAMLAPHVISVASFSKTFGLPGIRIGWLMTQDAPLYERFFAAKEQIQICGSALDEEIAFQFYSKKERFLPKIIEQLNQRFGILKGWMDSQSDLEWVEPKGGCVAFPRFTDSTLKKIDLDQFYQRLNRDFYTHVGPGHWFEQHRRYMRIGYGWPSHEELRKGLSRLSEAIRLSGV